jgi:hypothetical protein
MPMDVSLLPPFQYLCSVNVFRQSITEVMISKYITNLYHSIPSVTNNNNMATWRRKKFGMGAKLAKIS